MDEEDNSKVSQLRPPKPKQLDPRLEEIRNLLKASETFEATTPGDGEVTQEEAISDENVIPDEDEFLKRFGAGFSWGLRHRRDLMRLKKEYDLSDGEIILFHRTGNLHRTPFGVDLSVNRWFTAWGAIQFMVFLGLTLFSLIVLWPQLNTLSMLALKGWAIIGFTSAVTWSIYALYLLPWRVFRRVEQQRS